MADDTVMRDQFIVHCGKCGYSWALCTLPIPITRFVKAGKGAVAGGCPQCGAFGKGVVFTGYNKSESS